MTSVVINEVYGGGGNSGATYTNDFIELTNRSDAAVSLDGWSVQYHSGGATGTWQVTPLSGSIAPGGFYLVGEAKGAAWAPRHCRRRRRAAASRCPPPPARSRSSPAPRG